MSRARASVLFAGASALFALACGCAPAPMVAATSRALPSVRGGAPPTPKPCTASKAYPSPSGLYTIHVPLCPSAPELMIFTDGPKAFGVVEGTAGQAGFFIEAGEPGGELSSPRKTSANGAMTSESVIEIFGTRATERISEDTERPNRDCLPEPERLRCVRFDREGRPFRFCAFSFPLSAPTTKRFEPALRSILEATTFP